MCVPESLLDPVIFPAPSDSSLESPCLCLLPIRVSDPSLDFPLAYFVPALPASCQCIPKLDSDCDSVPICLAVNELGL